MQHRTEVHTRSRIATRPHFFALPAFVLLLAACSSDASTGVANTDATEGGATVAAGRSGSGSASGTGSNSTTAENCNGTIGPISVEEVYVPQGKSCTLDGTRVDGNVKVAEGGTVIIQNRAYIDGNVQAEDARAVTTSSGTVVKGDIQVKRRALATIENTRIDGNLQVEESGASLISRNNTIDGDLQVKKAGGASISATVVNGNIQLEENSLRLRSEGARVLGNFQVFKNRGGVTLLSNRIAQSLQCKENSPAPIGSGNIAGEKEDQCRRL